MMKLSKKIALCYEKLSRIATSEIVGESVLGREIRLFRFGTDPKIVLFGGIHAREWITTLLLTRLAEEESGLSFDLVPCLNPDGASLCFDGINSVPDGLLRQELLKINGSDDFSLWKANARAVDLNVNFDADWGEGRLNVTEKSPLNYIGPLPESEPETRVAVNVLAKNYALAVSFHSLGEEVYWGYESNFRFYKEAKTYADYLNYALKRSEHSSGGLKDYYALNYDGLGLTVEVGEEKYGHPYPESELEKLVKKHSGSIKLLTELGEKIYDRLYGGSVKGSEKGI